MFCGSAQKQIQLEKSPYKINSSPINQIDMPLPPIKAEDNKLQLNPIEKPPVPPKTAEKECQPQQKPTSEIQSEAQPNFIASYAIQDIKNKKIILNGRVWRLRWSCKNWKKEDLIEIYKDQHHYHGQYKLKNLMNGEENYGSATGTLKPEIRGNNLQLEKNKKQVKGYIESINREEGYFYINSNGYSVLIEISQISGEYIPQDWNDNDWIILTKKSFGYELKNTYTAIGIINCENLKRCFG